MTPTKDEVARIAAELTVKRRAALLALTTDWVPAPRSVSRQAIASLASMHSDLVEREWQEGCAQCTYYRLTPLGEQVSAFIRNGEGDA